MATKDSPTLTKKEKSRGQWKRPIEFILSLVGFCVGMSSVWRFPYLAMRNGGGAFLIPYTIFGVVVGIPIVFMETALGQYFQLSPLLIFDMCPLFKGLGVSITLVSFIGFVYYMVILAWALYFLAMCFTPVLPWSTCGNHWNTNSCIPLFSQSPDNPENVTVVTALGVNKSGHMATEEFWNYNVLEISSGIEDLGYIPWHLLLALIAAFVLVYVCIFKGIESSRIAVYITVTAPCFLLMLLLAWLLTRPGSTDGLLFYITPRWEQIMHFQTWLEAFLHVFYSMGPGYGGLINLSSYNPFNHNCLRDSIIVVLADVTTAIVCGAVVFAGVGCIAHQAGQHVADVITAGPGLSFITYPHVVASMPVSQLWAVCFFLLILSLGLDSQFAMLKTATTGLSDLYPGKLEGKQPLLVFVVLVVSLLLSLPLVTRGGMYVFQIVDWYNAIFTILIVAFCESIIIGWVYGADRFLDNIKEMGSFGPSWFLRLMKFSWQFLVPFCMLFAVIVAMVKFRSPKYGEYVYPDWTNLFGWSLAVITSVPIPVTMAYRLIKAEGSLSERIKSTTRPLIGVKGVKLNIEMGEVEEFGAPERTNML